MTITDYAARNHTDADNVIDMLSHLYVGPCEWHIHDELTNQQVIDLDAVVFAEADDWDGTEPDDEEDEEDEEESNPVIDLAPYYREEVNS